MTAPAMTAQQDAIMDQIMVRRKWSRRIMGAFYLFILGLVVWSVQVTVVDDTDWERIGSLGKVLEATNRFIGIDFGLFPSLVGPAIETFMIACLGTLLGVIICIPAAWFGAANITPYRPVTYPLARFMMTLSRSIHEIVWALFFVAAVGLGALAGVFALAVRSLGFIAKMSAEAIEDIDPGPVDAMRATGANEIQVIIFAVLPQVWPQILSVVVFEWEINIRRSAILGFVGAGGLGLVFFRQMNTFNYYGVTSVIITILLLIIMGEFVSHYARKSVI